MTGPAIDRDVPLPDWTRLEQTMLAMRPGDSTFFAGKRTTWAANAIRRHRIKNPELRERKFTTRREGDGVRIWRMT